MSIKLLFALPLLILSAHSLFAQTAPEDNLPQLTIYSRTVVEDVVVVDKTGKAVSGLQKEDFQVFDNGKPQTITFFEPNFGAIETPTSQSMSISDTFTNIRLAEPGRVTNILLLDALDSWSEDEMYAHVQMVKYLASLPPHLRIGIFTLAPEKLNLVWPLNEDSSALKSAISQFSSKHSAPSSPCSASSPTCRP